ncbi:MAG: tRNA lysidine(34) synthetase TilS [Aquificaceae bacterium]
MRQKEGLKKSSSLLRKIITLQRQRKLIPEGKALLMAFSGGVDSVALALAMMELKNFLKLRRLALAHINHGIRGDESKRDEEFAKKFGNSKGLEVFVEGANVKKMAKERGENLEAVAREVRYKLLREIKEKEGFDLLATAHHLNDLLETVLLWLVRGSGLEGLTGFDEKMNDLIRPLYTSTREEIVEFVQSRNESWIEDSTNYDLRYARNRIRHMVVPELKKINPRLEESVLRLVSLLRDEEDFLKKEMQRAMDRCVKGYKADREELMALHPAIQRKLLSEWLGIKNMKKVEQIMRVQRYGGSANLGGGLLLEAEGNHLHLKRNQA